MTATMESAPAGSRPAGEPVVEPVAEARPRSRHLAQVDLVRIVPMIGVVSVHTLIFTQPTESIGANALLMILHANREVFFFVTAFVLFLSTRGGDTGDWWRFWRRRYPVVVAPYLAWTLIYWVQSENGRPWPPGPALQLLGVDLALGWFHLYFLLVTMQLYALCPILFWLVRRTRGRHWWLLGISAAVQLGCMALLEYANAYLPGAVQTWLSYAQVEATSYQLAFVAGALAADHIDDCLAWLRRHGRLALGFTVGAVVATEVVFLVNLTAGRGVQWAADVFQPASLLPVAAAIVGLALLADRLVRTHAQDGRLWRGLRLCARASFGVYLAHMLPLQLLLLTPAATLIGVEALPRPVRAVVVLALVLGVTFALVVGFQRTRLSTLLTGRPSATRGGSGRPRVALDASATRSAG